MGTLPISAPAVALLTAVKDAISTAKEGWGVLEKLKDLASPSIHDRPARELIERAVDGVLTIGTKTLLKRINNVHGRQ